MGIVVALVFSILLVGCATPQEPAPTMPKFVTEKIKACARECQSTYARCNTGCSQIGLSFQPVRHQPVRGLSPPSDMSELPRRAPTWRPSLRLCDL